MEANQPNQSQTSITPNTQPTDTSPTTQTSPQPTPKTKIFWLLISLIVLLISTTGVLGYKYYELKQQLDNQQSTPLSSPQLVTSSPAPVTSPNLDESDIPDDWSYQTNGECAVNFPIPPKIKPYFQPRDPNSQPSVTNEEGSGRFWDFPRGVVYPNLLSKVAQYESTKQAGTVYATVDEASGYVSQAVSVSCAPNSKFNNNADLISALSLAIDEYNKSDKEKGMQPNTYTITSQKSVNRWNKQVTDLVVAEGNQNSEYTLFITPQYIYEVRVFGATQDNFVQKTAQKIFDNLKFN